jgi:hypothetical protein
MNNNTKTNTTNTSTPVTRRIRHISEVIKLQKEKIDDYPPIITGNTVIIVR